MFISKFMNKIYEQNLWTKFIFVPFIIVNSIFNTVNSGKCCDCCDECFNSGEKNEEEIFSKEKSKLIEIQESEPKLEVLKKIFDLILSKSNKEENGLQVTQITEKGGFSVVFKCKIKEFYFCVKQLKTKYDMLNTPGKKTEKTCLEREIKNMDILKDKEGFLDFYGGYVYKDNIFLCMEYCELGDLDDYLQKNDVSAIYNNFYKDILGILKTLRENKITHKDIKPANFLVKKTNNSATLKLADFGLSSEAQNSEPDKNLISKAKCGCYAYKSPVFKNFYIKQNEINVALNAYDFYNAYNEDLFSAACIMYMMKNKENPDFCSILTSSDGKEEILKKFKKDIEAFKTYLNSEDFSNNKDELYNKIFWKFKEKKDNETIDIDEFINELNTNN